MKRKNMVGLGNLNEDSQDGDSSQKEPKLLISASSI